MKVPGGGPLVLPAASEIQVWRGVAVPWHGDEFSADGILFVISENRRRKYVEILQRYINRNRLLRPQASQLAGRLNWACNALFGRCGRAFLSPILARAWSWKARPELNRDLAFALCWWRQWLSAPRADLSRFIPAAPRPLTRPALSYSDASTSFGLGGVVLLPASLEALWFRTRVPPGDPIDRLEVEAAAVANQVFGPLLTQRGYVDEIAFIDNNVSGAWVTRGRGRADVDPNLSAMWLQMAVRGGFKWFERVSSASNLADRPSRGLVPVCPCGWRLQELSGVLRWSPEDHAASERP